MNNNQERDEENDLLLERPVQPRLSNSSGSSRRSNFGFEMQFGEVRNNITSE